jgi:X-X-X-Leu-X-X-Gly heptad repeat protein
MNRKSLRVGLCAALLAALAMCAVPAVSMATGTGVDHRQNKRLTRHGTAIKKLGGAVGTVVATVKQIDGRLKTIEGAAPQIIDGLTQLKDAATKLKDGLTQLKDATTAGFGKVTTTFKSTEYGIAQVIVLEPAPNAQEGSFVETPDIPDAVQQAQSTQQFLAQQTGNLAVAYGVRSGESDGTGAALPAAYCKVTVTNEAGATQTTAGNATFGGLPFQPVNDKSALTSTDPANAGFPFGLKTSGADADHTTTLVTTVPVTAGDTYTVGLACVDTTADATDPTA